MRRNNNLINNNTKHSDKVVFFVGIGVAIILIIIISTLIYANGLQNEIKQDITTSENTKDEIKVEKTEKVETESASTEMGKTVEEVEMETLEKPKDESIDNKINNSIILENANEKIKQNEQIKETIKSEEVKEKPVVKEKVKLNFIKPVEGEIMRGFAKDNLVYSDTLEEWVTHLGIDIKADKTTVVNAAEVGVIKSIKNDPRYGLTIVMEHGNNFETVYSNLLSSEFVVEGEKVEKGQAIGTVGNTAPFEIADEPHLHFEILENSIQVDPMLYLK